MGSTISGRAHGGNTSIEADRVTASQKSGVYSTIETVLSNGAANSALTALAGASAFFSDLGGRANFFEIYSDVEISLRFRTAQNTATPTASLPAVTIRANTTMTIDWIADVTEVYMTNASGANANIKVRAI